MKKILLPFGQGMEKLFDQQSEQNAYIKIALTVGVATGTVGVLYSAYSPLGKKIAEILSKRIPKANMYEAPIEDLNKYNNIDLDKLMRYSDMYPDVSTLIIVTTQSICSLLPRHIAEVKGFPEIPPYERVPNDHVVLVDEKEMYCDFVYDESTKVTKRNPVAVS